MTTTTSEVTQIEEPERQTTDDIASSVSVSSDDVTVEADGLQASLSTHASEFSVNEFKCPTCSLVHHHTTNKHRATDSFDLSVEDTLEMDYNPNCHCAVNELARHGSDFGVDEDAAASVASSAPIPEATAQEMAHKY